MTPALVTRRRPPTPAEVRDQVEAYRQRRVALRALAGHLEDAVEALLDRRALLEEVRDDVAADPGEAAAAARELVAVAETLVRTRVSLGLVRLTLEDA